MLPLTSRAVRWTVALAIPTLAACSDDSAQPTGPALAAKLNANLAAGDVVIVTNASGGTGPGSLRGTLANIWTDGVIVRFDPSLEGDTITVDSTIVVHASLIIEGPKNKGITLNGGGRFRVIYLGESAELRNVTITGGYDPVIGGGIYARNGLYLYNSTVAFNSAPTAGGIYAHAAGIFNSTVARNTATQQGAGIYLAYLGYSGGSLSLYNSTVAQNGPAAGVQYSTATTPYESTILSNSIIANNGTPTKNCVGIHNVTYEGNNLANDPSCGPSDKVRVADAKLGTLAYRGGPAETIDFARESPALNAGITCFSNVDERYVTRDAKCDLGAFEFTDFTTVTLTIDANGSVDPATGSAVVTGTVKCSRDGDQFGVVVNAEQQKGTKVVQGIGVAGVSCTTTAKPWSATLTPELGAFDASAMARTNDTNNRVTPATTSRSIKLARARR